MTYAENRVPSLTVDASPWAVGVDGHNETELRDERG